MLWLVLGALELILHDVGNERRFVIFIPALVALTAIVLGGGRALLPPTLASLPRRRALLAAPILLYGLYVIFGSHRARSRFSTRCRPNVRMRGGPRRARRRSRIYADVARRDRRRPVAATVVPAEGRCRADR